MIASRLGRRVSAIWQKSASSGRAFSAVAALGLTACGAAGPDLESAGLRVAAGNVSVLAPALSSAVPYGRDRSTLTKLAAAEHLPAPEASAGTGSFLIEGFHLPVEDQLDAGSCLYMAGTGIMEWLINKHLAIAEPEINSATDLSERYTLTIADRLPLANNFTDVVYLFRDAGAYVLDRDLRFLKQNGSTQINWTPVDERGLNRKTDLPAFTRKVLFTSNGNQLAYGVMHDSDLQTIKDQIRTLQSPVLFVFHPPTVAWWHADVIIGYDDAKQVFYTRDSAFGAARSDLPRYGYGTATTADDDNYLDIFELTYAQAKAWGNHASIYYLTE